MQYDLDKLFIATIQPHRRGRTLRWHVGSNIKGIENVSTIVHSDTLFSALCHAWGRLFGQADLEAGLNRFRAGDAPFRLSSTFPFLPRSDSPRYFVPKPALPIPQSEDKRLFLKYAKSLREAEFIDLDTLLDWLDLRDADNPQAGEYEALYKQIQKSNEDYQEIFWAGTEMGIVTDRIGASSPNPFIAEVPSLKDSSLPITPTIFSFTAMMSAIKRGLMC